MVSRCARKLTLTKWRSVATSYTVTNVPQEQTPGWRRESGVLTRRPKEQTTELVQRAHTLRYLHHRTHKCANHASQEGFGLDLQTEQPIWATCARRRQTPRNPLPRPFELASQNLPPKEYVFSLSRSKSSEIVSSHHGCRSFMQSDCIQLSVYVPAVRLPEG